MAQLSYHEDAPIAEADGSLGSRWRQWFSRVNTVIVAMQQSGITADRPASLVWIGRQYFDTTLGKPVYVLSVNPVVWVDSAGTTV